MIIRFIKRRKKKKHPTQNCLKLKVQNNTNSYSACDNTFTSFGATECFVKCDEERCTIIFLENERLNQSLISILDKF